MEERSRELDLELGYKGANLKKSISILHFLAIAVIHYPLIILPPAFNYRPHYNSYLRSASVCSAKMRMGAYLLMRSSEDNIGLHRIY